MDEAEKKNYDEEIECEAELREKIAELEEQLICEKAINGLVKAGVDPKKAERAAKMLDLDEIVSEGCGLDPELLAKEAYELLEEFPDLRAGAYGGVKIGAKPQPAATLDDVIGAIFGNRKQDA